MYNVHTRHLNNPSFASPFNPRCVVTCDFGKARIFDKSRQADRSLLHQEAKYGQVINLFGFAFSFFDY